MRSLGRFSVLAAAFGMSLFAQSGVVRSAGQPIPGATVTAVQGNNRNTTVTDQNGHFGFPSLGPGTWTLEVSMFGFAPAKKDFAGAGTNNNLDFSLQLEEPAASGNIDLGGLPTGLYAVQFLDDNGAQVAVRKVQRIP